MNREIKFRAYDSVNKVMEYDVNVNQGKPVKQGYQWFNESNTVYHSELMQYTGLNDKNDTPIYEGDIVINSGMWVVDSPYRFRHRESYGKGEKFVVHHNVSGYEFRHVNDWNGNKSKKFTPNGWKGKPYIDNYDAWNLQKTFEVIGNIYENPELVGVSND